MNKIVTITGPSCAGKSTLEKLMVEHAGFERVISTTTRTKREGETDGDSYFFMSKSEFKRLERMGYFVESVSFNNNYYGVSVKELRRVFEQGKPVVIVCEPDGQKQIKKYAEANGLEVYSVFLCNPPEVVAKRFLTRFYDEGAGRREEVINIYAARMAGIMTTELGWVIEAAMKENPYDEVFWEFNEETTAEILAQLKEKETA